MSDTILSDGIITIRLEKIYNSAGKYRYVTHYFGIYQADSVRRIGYTDLRVGNNYYLDYLGHVGYRILQPYRGHSYAYRAVCLLFEYARQIGFTKLLITCNPDNIPSRKTLDKLNGECLGNKEIPNDHPLKNEKTKRIYYYDLEKR